MPHGSPKVNFRILKAIMLALPAVAASAENPDGGEKRGERAPELAPVEATAYRFASAALDQPVNSTVIGSDEIEKSGASTVPEMLQRTGSVRFMSYTGDSSNGNIAMRGFGENSQLRVLVLVDGQRYNRADMSETNWLQIPLSNVESIEVLRGAQSAMYGNNAVAGVVKISTKKDAEENAIELNGMMGSYGLYSADASFRGSAGGFGYGIDANRYNNDGYRENSRAWADTVNASASCKISDSAKIELAGNFSLAETEYATGTDWNGFQNNPRDADLRMLYKYKGGVYSATLKNESALGRGEIQFGANFRNRIVEESNALAPSQNRNDQLTFTLSPRCEIDRFEDWTLYAGADADFTSIDFDSYRFFASGAQNPDRAKVERGNMGGYAGAEYRAADNLIFSASARAEGSYTSADSRRFIYMGNRPPRPAPQNTYDESQWQGGFAGSFGATYKLDGENSVYARFDQIYRYPSTDEIAFYQGYYQASAFPFNKDLKPETGQNYEIGYTRISGGWRVNLSFYATYLDNEIMYDYASGLNENFSSTRRLGADFSVRYDSEYFGVFAGAGAVDARFASGRHGGNKIPLVPPFSGTAGITLKPVEGLELTARGNWSMPQTMGNDFANSMRRIPGFATFDLLASYRICKYAAVFGAIENVFNENYAVFAYNGSYYPCAGRVFKMGISLKY